jgi:hypothetical protein
VRFRLIAPIELAPHDQPRSTREIAAIQRRGSDTDADLARLETLASLAKSAVLDSDLGSEATQPEPAVWAHRHRVHVVAARVSYDTVKHPTEEGRRICSIESGHGSSSRPRRVRGIGRPHGETVITMASITASRRSAIDTPLAASI